VVEGAELLSVALAAGAPVEAVFVAPNGRRVDAVAGAVLEAHQTGARVFDLAQGVIERVAETVTPQPVLAVVGFSPSSIEALTQASMVVVCVDVRDPGNAGTVIRTADAAGVDAVICCDGTVDPTNPKTVRASAGSIFHVPVVHGGDATATVEALGRMGFTTVGTSVHEGEDYVAFDWHARTAIILGNEAVGLAPATLGALDRVVTIPMEGRAESLNVGVSAAVLCFEALRQRRGSGWIQPGSTMPGMDASTPGPLSFPGIAGD